MSEYPVTLPTIISAGSNVEFAMKAYNLVGEELLTGDSYTCYYVLSNADNNYSVSSTTYGDQGFVFVIPYATTSGFTAGDYSSQLYADDGTNRYPQTNQYVTVRPSLDDAAEGRTNYRQIRDALTATILGQASSNQLSMSVAGRAIQRMSLDELSKAEAHFDALVQSEEDLQAMKEGKPTSRTVNTRLGGWRK